MEWVTFYYAVHGRFSEHFHPRGEMHELESFDTKEEAIAAMEKIKNQGTCSDLMVEHVEIPMENNRNIAPARKTIIAKWHQKKARKTPNTQFIVEGMAQGMNKENADDAKRRLLHS